MKVCFLVSNLMSGGVERTVVYVSKYFAKHGVDTTILSLSNEIFYTVDPAVKLKTLGIPRGYSNPFQKIIRMYSRMNGVRKNILGEQYDVVFCMAPEMARYIMPIRKSGAFKLISSERNNPKFDNERDKRIKEKLFPQCDGIVFQTRRAMECFPKSIQERGVVIPNAVGNELAYEIQAASVKKKKFSAVGRLTKQKDYETMIRAFALFCRDNEDYELEIFGKGEDEDKLRTLSSELNISERVKFLGVSQEALKRISDSQAFLLSSIYEGIPNVLLEAMAIGMPCISTDCPFGPRELIQNNDNGILVPVADVEAFAQAMDKFAKDTELASKCGDKAREVLNKYNIEEISRKYLDYVTQICMS